MTRKYIFVYAVGVFILGWLILQGPDTDKPETIALDYSKSVYTTDHAIVCPLGLLFDVRADRGPEAVMMMFLRDDEDKAKEIGCEVWRGGVRVEAVKMEQESSETFHLTQINGTLFTAEVHLTNSPTD
jgi:hypothetical protein